MLLAVSLMAGPGPLGEGPSPNTVSITLEWDDTNPPGLVDHFTIYSGPSSGNYTSAMSAGKILDSTGTNYFVVVPGLARGVAYYFAATCTDITGLESDFSNEVSYTAPTKPRPPVNFRNTQTQ